MSNVPIGIINQRPEFDVSFQEFEHMPEQYSFVGLKVLAPVIVGRRSGTFYVRTAKERLRDGYAKRKPDGSFNRLQRKFGEVEYATRRIALEERIDDERREMFPDFDAGDADTVRELWDTIIREIEAQTTTILQDTSTFANTTVGATWQNHSASTPVADILGAISAMKASSGLIADTAVIGFGALLNLIQSEEFIDRIKFWGGTDPTARHLSERLDILAAGLGIRRLLVAGADFDSADYGQPAVFEQFWDNDNIGIYKTATPDGSIAQPAVGRTIVFPSKGGGVTAGDAVLSTVQYREEQTESDVFRASWYMDPKVLNEAAGYILTGADAAP